MYVKLFLNQQDLIEILPEQLDIVSLMGLGYPGLEVQGSALEQEGMNLIKQLQEAEKNPGIRYEAEDDKGQIRKGYCNVKIESMEIKKDQVPVVYRFVLQLQKV